MLQFLKRGYEKLRTALGKTSSLLGGKLRQLFGAPIDETTFEQLEQLLYEADLGANLASEISEAMRRFLKRHPSATTPELIEEIERLCLEILEEPPSAHFTPPTPGSPKVILIVGVNGSGKTTSLAKLAHRFTEEGHKVLVAAGDTFRAGATLQLRIWAERLSLPFVSTTPGGDPAAVAFDAISAAKARGCDLVLIDTAGRLQNKEELMRELTKIRRACDKALPGAPHETLLVLDATTGQNALEQALAFHEATPLSGLILAKLDGSARGGMALAIYRTLKLPLLFIGSGEQKEDLLPFDSSQFVHALFD